MDVFAFLGSVVAVGILAAIVAGCFTDHRCRCGAEWVHQGQIRTCPRCGRRQRLVRLYTIEGDSLWGWTDANDPK